MHLSHVPAGIYSLLVCEALFRSTKSSTHAQNEPYTKTAAPLRLFMLHALPGFSYLGPLVPLRCWLKQKQLHQPKLKSPVVFEVKKKEKNFVYPYILGDCNITHLL